MTRLRSHAWIALLCVALVTLTIATAGAGLPFDGVLVLVWSLFALALVSRVLPAPSAEPRTDIFVVVRQGRAPPAA